MKVHAIILGAQKCGTTTLFDLMAAHPQLEGCRTKEPHFFSTTKDWRKEWPRYEALFPQREGALHFEASTSYTFHPLRNPDIAGDLYAHNPDMRLIYLVRDPVQRVLSSWMHAFERGYTDLPLQQEIIANRLHLDATRYATQIGPFIRRFGRDAVLILDLAELEGDAHGTLQRVAKHLGVDPGGFPPPDGRRLNVSVGGGKVHHRWDHPGPVLRALRQLSPAWWRSLTDNRRRAFASKPAVPPQLRRLIVDQLSVEIDALAELMGRDLRHWKWQDG